jgi:hypothetical protein
LERVVYTTRGRVKQQQESKAIKGRRASSPRCKKQPVGQKEARGGKRKKPWKG